MCKSVDASVLPLFFSRASALVECFSVSAEAEVEAECARSSRCRAYASRAAAAIFIFQRYFRLFVRWPLFFAFAARPLPAQADFFSPFRAECHYLFIDCFELIRCLRDISIAFAAFSSFSFSSLYVMFFFSYLLLRA